MKKNNKKNIVFFKCRTLLLISILMVFLPLIPLSAGYLVSLTNLELYLEHDLILFGKVLSSKIEVSSTPMTAYEIEILQYIKGEFKENQITVVGLGNINSTSHVEMETILTAGQKGLFMLDRLESGKWFISPYSNTSELVDPDLHFVLPPLKLFKSGIPAEQIHCKMELKFALKSSNNTPICLKLESFERLLQRGWIK